MLFFIKFIALKIVLNKNIFHIFKPPCPSISIVYYCYLYYKSGENPYIL